MEEIYARIEDYLDDLLTPTDRADFEAQLSAHPELAADLEQVREARARLARQLAEQNDDAALTKTLQAIGQQHFSSTATPSPSLRAAQPPSSRRWWLAAAAVIAAAFITWLMWPKADTPARLYAEHRRFPEANFTFKGSENAAQSLQTTANFFNQKNYTAALGGFQQYFSTGAVPGQVKRRGTWRSRICEAKTWKHVLPCCDKSNPGSHTPMKQVGYFCRWSGADMPRRSISGDFILCPEADFRDT